MLKYVAKDGIHLGPDGKSVYAWSVLQVCEQKKFSKDEFPPLQHPKSEASPLQSMDMQLANFEAKKREEKKKRVDAILIDSWSERLLKDNNVSVKKEMHVKCTSLCKERKTQKIEDVSIKVAPKEKTEKKKRKEKKSKLQRPIDCGVVDAFINRSILRKQKSGEERQVDRLVKNILRKRSVKDVCSSPLHHYRGVFPSADSFADQPNGLSADQSKNLSGDKPDTLSAGQFVGISDDQLVGVSGDMSIGLSVDPSFGPDVDPSIDLSVNLSADPSYKLTNISFYDHSVGPKIDQQERANAEMRLRQKIVSFEQRRAATKTKDMTFQRITEPNNPCNFGKKQQQKVVKKMKKFFNCFTSKSHYQTSEKIRVTYHTQNGIMVEHVESDGSCNVIFDNLNLCGGGRKRMPVKNEKRKGSKGQNKMKIERKN